MLSIIVGLAQINSVSNSKHSLMIKKVIFQKPIFWRLVLLIFAINSFIPPVAKANLESASVCSQDLSLEIDSIIDRPEFSKSRWGILVQNLSSGKTLYSRDRDKYFVPASNVKLLTSASALLELGGGVSD